MNTQICSIIGGKLKHLYIKGSTMWFSSTKATLFTPEESRKLLNNPYVKDSRGFVQSEYDCHFRPVDSIGYKVSYVNV